MSAFEIQDPADEQPISLADPEEQDLPDELLSPEELAERQARLDADAKAAADKKAEETSSVIEKFSGILKVLEESPSPRHQAAPDPQQQQPQQPSQEQINEWNDKLRELQVTNPVQYAAMMREGAVEEATRRIMGQAGGVIDSAGEGFIARFKSDKKGESRFFNQIEKLFDKEMADLPARNLLQMDTAQRKLELGRRWKAAAGEFFEANAKPTQTLSVSASRGTSVAPSNGGRTGREKVASLSDGEKIALLRALGKDKAKAEIARIEYGL